MNYERRQNLHSILGNVNTWNEFGVCLNPKVIIDWRVKGGYLEIKIAQKDNGKYVYGFNLDYSTGGQGFSPNIVDDGYKSEREAKEAALQYARKCIEKSIEWHRYVRNDKEYKGVISSLNQLLTKVKEECFEERQYSLF